MIEARSRVAAIATVRRHGLPASERRALLVALDITAVSVALVAAFNLRTSQVRGLGFAIPWNGLAVVLPAWLLAAAVAGGYEARSTVDARAAVRIALTAVGCTLALLIAVFFAFPFGITRPTIVLWAVAALPLVLGGRLAYGRLVASGGLAGRVVVVAPPAALDGLSLELGGLYEVVGTVDPARGDGAARLAQLVDSTGADQVVLGVRDDVPGEIFNTALRCHERGVTVRSLGDLCEELSGRILLDQLGHTWLMALPMRSETSRLYMAFKRAVDIGFAALALVLLAVLLVPIGLAAPLVHRGPLLHSQPRVGKYGRVFRLWKLRTMRDPRPADTGWTRDRDARVTRLGRVLRRTHLDELPQAWSVLRGDMSLIGPRPEQPHYVEELRDRIPFYSTRLTVRPGITGWAQVNFGYGSGTEGARTKLSYDLYYIKRQSVSLDLLIAARTVLHVLSLGGR